MNRPIILALIIAWAVAGFTGGMATTIGLMTAKFSYAVGGLALLGITARMVYWLMIKLLEETL